MSDEDIFGMNDSADEPEPGSPADTGAETPAAPGVPVVGSDAGSTVDEFVNETTPVDMGVDANAMVTLRTSSGQSHYVAVTEAMRLADLKLRSGLTFTTGTQFFLNGTPITDDTVVPTGATIVAVGSVKGG